MSFTKALKPALLKLGNSEDSTNHAPKKHFDQNFSESDLFSKRTKAFDASFSNLFISIEIAVSQNQKRLEKVEKAATAEVY